MCMSIYNSISIPMVLNIVFYVIIRIIIIRVIFTTTS